MNPGIQNFILRSTIIYAEGITLICAALKWRQNGEEEKMVDKSTDSKFHP